MAGWCRLPNNLSRGKSTAFKQSTETPVLTARLIWLFQKCVVSNHTSRRFSPKEEPWGKQSMGRAICILWSFTALINILKVCSKEMFQFCCRRLFSSKVHKNFAVICLGLDMCMNLQRSNICIILSPSMWRCAEFAVLSHPVVSSSLRPQDCSPPGLLCNGDSSGKNAAVGCHALLQGIFPTQGWNPSLLHCRRILYCLSHQGNPQIIKVIFIFISRV